MFLNVYEFSLMFSSEEIRRVLEENGGRIEGGLVTGFVKRLLVFIFFRRYTQMSQHVLCLGLKPSPLKSL